MPSEFRHVPHVGHMPLPGKHCSIQVSPYLIEGELPERRDLEAQAYDNRNKTDGLIKPPQNLNGMRYQDSFCGGKFALV